jgi:hypothetical protein
VPQHSSQQVVTLVLPCVHVQYCYNKGNLLLFWCCKILQQGGVEMITVCRGWICGAFTTDGQSTLPSMTVAVREIHSCTVRCLKHDILQNCADSIASHLAVFHRKICSTFGDSLLHLNEKCIVRVYRMLLILLGYIFIFLSESCQMSELVRSLLH